VKSGAVLPTGTVTFMVTDVEGSAVGWDSAPQAMSAALAEHDTIVDGAIVGHGGIRLVEQGDSVVAVFIRSSDAVEAALEAQRLLQAEPWAGGLELAVRMAVHAGPVVVRGEGNYAGSTLNHSRRLLEVGHGGQVLLSSSTVELVIGGLPAGASLVDLGARLLSDLTRAARVWQLAHPDLEAEFPPLRSLDSYRHNLPQQVTPLVGRVEELAAIGRALDTDRLLTLTGTAGVGKTRLAVHAAAERVERHRGGVWFVELAAMGDPGGVASAVANVLRVWETASEPTAEAIVRFVGDREALLVLDNCEHVTTACADLADAMLAGCSQLTILATSREPLGVPGEITWAVSPLPAPPRGGPIDMIRLSRFDAVRLFGDRARRARPDFVLTDANAPAVANLCARLDGIPLALELAAARCRSLTPEQIERQLDQRFRLLTGGSRTRLPRQQTLEASLAWSYDLLAADEQSAFRRLGVFSGAFPLEAAEVTCAGDDVAAAAVFDVLGRLVDKSLVVHDPDSGWYRMLETLRVYAIERCVDHGELLPLRDAHAHWWSSWLAALGPEAPSDADIDIIDSGYSNLRAALEWAATTEHNLALELAGGLGVYWNLRGMLGDSVILGDLALDVGRASDPGMWARTVGLIANTRRYASDTSFFTDTIPEACRIAENTGDALTPLRCRAAPVVSIGTVAEFEELADAARQLGERWVEARMRECLALFRPTLTQPDNVDVRADRSALNAIAHELDASTFRVAHHIAAAHHIAPENLTAAIDEAGAALSLLDRASSTTALLLIRSLAWFGTLRGDRATVARSAAALRDLARDWGVLAPLARALSELPALLDGEARWEGSLTVTPAIGSSGEAWLWSEIAGDDVINLEGRSGLVVGSGELGQSRRMHRDTSSAFAAGRYRDAEPGVAELARRRYEDQHLWLLALARCAADADRLTESARLLGAVATHQEKAGAPWLPRILRIARDETENLAHTALGEEGFAAAVAEGRALDLQDAVAYALRARGQRKRPPSGWDSLTPTELQVAKEVATGNTNAEIAAALLMARTTVKTHLAHIFTKLGYTNRAELAAEATRRASSPTQPVSSTAR
jgi:predicted ATPase/class 3 adenylate cyclase/DNA-binding CsgD family transcriptional regulator